MTVPAVPIQAFTRCTPPATSHTGGGSKSPSKPGNCSKSWCCARRYPPSFASLVLARELLFQSRHQVLVYQRREEHHLLLPVRRVVVGANLERDVSVTVLASQPTEVAPLRQRRPRPAEVAEAHGLIGIEIVALELLRGDPLGAFERVLRVDRHRGVWRGGRRG